MTKSKSAHQNDDGYASEFLIPFFIITAVFAILLLPLIFHQSYTLPQENSEYATFTSERIGQTDVPIVWGTDASDKSALGKVFQFTDSKPFNISGSHWVFAYNSGVFKRLDTLLKGDTIEITSDGIKSTYKVVSSTVGTVTENYSNILDNQGNNLLNLYDNKDTLYMYTNYPLDSQEETQKKLVIKAELIEQKNI